MGRGEINISSSYDIIDVRIRKRKEKRQAALTRRPSMAMHWNDRFVAFNSVFIIIGVTSAFFRTRWRCRWWWWGISWTMIHRRAIGRNWKFTMINRKVSSQWNFLILLNSKDCSCICSLMLPVQRWWYSMCCCARSLRVALQCLWLNPLQHNCAAGRIRRILSHRF